MADYYMFICGAIVCLIWVALNINYFKLEHELGHALVAKRYSNKKPVIIVIPHHIKWKHIFNFGEYGKYQVDGILLYHVQHKKMAVLGASKSTGAFSSYDNSDSNKISWEQRLDITKGGPQKGKKYLLSVRYQLPMCILALFFMLVFKIVAVQFDVQITWENYFMVVVGYVIFQTAVTIGLYLGSVGVLPKNEIKKLEREIKNSSFGGSVHGGIGDRAKIKFQKEFSEALEDAWKKGIKVEDSYESVINNLKSIGIDAYKDYENIDSLPRWKNR